MFQEYVSTARPVDTFNSDTDETLLHFAALGGKRETMDRLVSAHVHDINAKTKTGWTPLLYALLPKIKGRHNNPSGRRTLHAAIRAAKLLLSYGANPLITTAQGWTPLHVLSLHIDEFPDGEAEALTHELISLGCSINPPPALAIAGKWHAMSEHIRYPQDRWQKLPLLHWAALHGAVDVVKALIESGANVFEQDMYNHTAKEVAESSEFLREHVHGGGPFKELGSVGKMILEVLDEARWRR
ncbi:ankyrin [Sarocladium strictum]